MHGELFDSTIPFGAPELVGAATYQHYLDGLDADPSVSGTGTRLSQLSPSLQADLLRFEEGGVGSEALEVMAACVRHVARLTLHLKCEGRVVPLTVFATERLVHCPIELAELVDRHLPTLRVMNVEPALLRPPGDPERSLIGALHQHHPLGPLLWQLAMRGPRRDLLPEIAGPAVYRVSLGLDAVALPTGGALRASIDRLRRQTANLAEIAGWPGLDRERASRLLNALYLQSGLIVSRSHPDAVRESWFAGL